MWYWNNFKSVLENIPYLYIKFIRMNTTISQQGGVVKKKFKLYAGRNNLSLFITARKGVKSGLFYDLAEVMQMSEKNLAEIIHVSPRTMSNYKEHKKSLDPVQSEHLLRLVALYEKGEELFGNLDEFNYWLQKPFWNDKEKPIDWLVTPGGIDLIINELTMLAYGDAV